MFGWGRGLTRWSAKSDFVGSNPTPHSNFFKFFKKEDSAEQTLKWSSTRL